MSNPINYSHLTLNDINQDRIHHVTTLEKQKYDEAYLFAVSGVPPIPNQNYQVSTSFPTSGLVDGLTINRIDLNLVFSYDLDTDTWFQI